MDLDAVTVDLGGMGSYGGPGVMQENAKLKIVNSGNGISTEVGLEARDLKKKGVVKYRECMKNHAASIGGHAIDGCGEFMPSGEEGTMEALKCAACDCHRNFHRREVDGEPAAALMSCEICIQAKKRGHLTPPHPHALALPAPGSASARPPPILMALNSRGPLDCDDPDNVMPPGMLQPLSPMKKRFRTKFSIDQKEKMCAFAEKLGWRIQKHDETAVQQFCSDVGVKRHVLKVWMHNNKHTFGKKPLPPSPPQIT